MTLDLVGNEGLTVSRSRDHKLARKTAAAFKLTAMKKFTNFGSQNGKTAYADFDEKITSNGVHDTTLRCCSCEPSGDE